MAQLNQLSNREQDVVKHLQQGKSNKLIASSLGISNSTVEFHLKNIYAKYQVSSRMELILKLGKSTVDGMGKTGENRDRFNSWMDWVTFFRDNVSIFVKELIMNKQSNTNSGFSNSKSHGESMMTFQEAIRVCLTKYAEFNGRASRSEFWWFFLFIILVGGALTYLSQNLSNIFLVSILLPFLAAGARRLHDIGKSGWWQLFLLAPVAGIVSLIILWAMPQTRELGDESVPS